MRHSYMKIFCVFLLLIFSPVNNCFAQSAGITYPDKSIGGIIKRMNDELRKPVARLIHFYATNPSSSNGVTFSGLQFSSFDTFSVRTNPEGNLLFVTIFSCEQRRGSAVVTRRKSLEINNIDPSAFTGKGANYVHNEALTNAIPEGHWVVVESKAQLKATSFRGKNQRAITLPRFGFGFTTSVAAKNFEELIFEIKKRADFEAEVKKLPSLIKFNERSDLYQKIHDELHRQETKIGFFRAASAVTYAFYHGVDRFSPDSIAFFNSLSQKLSDINSKTALQILRTGKLNSSGKLLKGDEEIDKELVNREQGLAEQEIGALGAKRVAIIDNVNKVTNDGLDGKGLDAFGQILSSVNSAKYVRDQKRISSSDNNAILDYGKKEERIQVGLNLCGKFRD